MTGLSINDSQFGFDPGRGTTDTTFVVRLLQLVGPEKARC